VRNIKKKANDDCLIKAAIKISVVL